MSFVREIITSKKQKLSDAEKIVAEDKRIEARDRDSQLVTGIFKNLEVPGGDLEFSYKMYKEENPRIYSFLDGQSYTIPLGVAKHINNMTAVPIRDYAKNPDGTKQLVTIITSKRQRYQFLSKEFM